MPTKDRKDQQNQNNWIKGSKDREKGRERKSFWRSLFLFRKKVKETPKIFDSPPADVIVNFSNTELISGYAFSKLLIEAAGLMVMEECDRIKFVPLGDFVLTPAGNLNSKLICHIPIVCYKENKKLDIDSLEYVLRQAVAKFSLMNYSSILIPLNDLTAANIDKNNFKTRIESLKIEFPQFQFFVIE